MVNYKRVVCEAAILALVFTTIAAAPVDCDKHYDQRQNGSENYRLNIDGVVIAVAPADALLAAASDIDFTDLLDIEDFDVKPKPPADSPPKPQLDNKPENLKPDPKPDAMKPEALSDVTVNEVKGQKKEASVRKQEKAQRLKHRLANILMPLLRRNRHH